MPSIGSGAPSLTMINIYSAVFGIILARVNFK